MFVSAVKLDLGVHGDNLSSFSLCISIIIAISKLGKERIFSQINNPVEKCGSGTDSQLSPRNKEKQNRAIETVM